MIFLISQRIRFKKKKTYKNWGYKIWPSKSANDQNGRNTDIEIRNIETNPNQS
jgi:hypothetical protein